MLYLSSEKGNLRSLKAPPGLTLISYAAELLSFFFGSSALESVLFFRYVLTIIQRKHYVIEQLP